LDANMLQCATALPEKVAKKIDACAEEADRSNASAVARTRSVGYHIVASNRGGSMRANSIVNWFVAMFADLGLEGSSSHSGRRTFITAAAKNVHRAGGSLRDVQLLAGHRSIETTQRYIEGDTPSQRRLVSLL
jgi:integrase